MNTEFSQAYVRILNSNFTTSLVLTNTIHFSTFPYLGNNMLQAEYGGYKFCGSEFEHKHVDR